MNNLTLPNTLSLVTIGFVLLVAVVFLMKARKSQAKRGETPGGIAGPGHT